MLSIPDQIILVQMMNYLIMEMLLRLYIYLARIKADWSILVNFMPATLFEQR